MSILVIVTAALAATSTIILAIGLYSIRRAAIAEGIDRDLIDPIDGESFIVNGTIAARWLVVTFLVAVAAGSNLLGMISSQNGSMAEGWSLLIITCGQLFAWAFALILRQENIRARTQHRLYKHLYGELHDKL